MNISKLKWYINRLSKMPPQEVVYRLNQAIKQQWDKRIYSCLLKVEENEQLNLQPIFKLSNRIFEKDNQELCKLIKQAKEILNNHFNIFGIKVDYGEKIDWHLDPKTRKRWPLKFWADIDIRDGFTIGDVKFVWEINRFYFMPTLGIAFQITNDQRFANKIFSLLSDWLEANPYPIGVNWTSGIELALRISNLIWALSFLKDYSINNEQKVLINRFIYLHAHHLIRYPSKYSSNNNHAIAEAFGLFLAGLYFKHLNEAKKWFAFGKKVLERELARQILPDGGSIECSTTYLSFVADFLLLFKLICDREYIEYNPILNDRLFNVCVFIQTIMDKNGNIPNIGDQDGAVVVNFGLDNWQNFKSILNSGAVIFQQPEFACDNYPDVKTKILFGDIVNDIIPKKRKLTSKYFKYTGLGVIRDEFRGKEILLCVNNMPLGMPPLYAHGHLDALSFTLSLDGDEIFIDPGTYLYHSGGKWRRYFRSTAAHNTIRINGIDFVKQTGDFMFESTYEVKNLLWSERCDKIEWKACCDAYLRRNLNILYSRYLIYIKKQKKVIIEDIFNTDIKKQYLVEWFLHLHPECVVERESNELVIKRENKCVVLHIDIETEPKIIKGKLNPILGWYSRKFNHLQETNTIMWSKHFSQTGSCTICFHFIK